MKKFAFYLLGKKGYRCLNRFLEEYGGKAVAFVVLARDRGVKNDYFDEISSLCRQHAVNLYDRSENVPNNFDVSFAIGWRWLIPDSYRLIVFHDSLLPKYRGFAPLVNMLINGEKKIGVTALYASLSYDAGHIIERQSIQITYPLKISEAIDRVADLYELALLRIAGRIVSGEELQGTPQDKTEATFSLWRDESDYQINWESGADELKRFVDAVGYPYSGAKTQLHGKSIRILDVDIVKDVKVESRNAHIGKVIFMDNGCPTVICGTGLIKLLNVIDENGDSLIGRLPFRTRFGA
ncbi:formyltransferase family protein [Salicola sp. Rm-C-2C1-2]|uniref:methionyl-tRNA formyltransferase n=1 Tax=Salicola sp. Rm-C-2C1-2 TaxID=3141321 RepID=UPI0032E3FF88